MVRTAVLRAFVIAMGLFLGAAFMVSSLTFKDGDWTPGIWPVLALAMFVLALLGARAKK